MKIDKDSCGVYEIVNTVNGKKYIGSGFVQQRRSQHFWHLSKDNHCNRHLQSSYNKYGKDSFKFNILLVSERDYALEIEQKLLDEEDKSNLYNILVDARYHAIRGEDIGNSKLKEIDIPLIIELLCDSKSAKEISLLFNVSNSCINDIAIGKTWTHITSPFLEEIKLNRCGRVGEKSKVSKLTEQQVREIRYRYPNEDCTQESLANEYGVEKPAVYKIINRLTWRHIK